jgi:hypothetical protein
MSPFQLLSSSEIRKLATKILVQYGRGFDVKKVRRLKSGHASISVELDNGQIRQVRI